MSEKDAEDKRDAKRAIVGLQGFVHTPKAVDALDPQAADAVARLRQLNPEAKDPFDWDPNDGVRQDPSRGQGNKAQQASVVLGAAAAAAPPPAADVPKIVLGLTGVDTLVDPVPGVADPSADSDEPASVAPHSVEPLTSVAPEAAPPPAFGQYADDPSQYPPAGKGQGHTARFRALPAPELNAAPSPTPPAAQPSPWSKPAPDSAPRKQDLPSAHVPMPTPAHPLVAVDGPDSVPKDKAPRRWLVLGAVAAVGLLAWLSVHFAWRDGSLATGPSSKATATASAALGAPPANTPPVVAPPAPSSAPALPSASPSARPTSSASSGHVAPAPATTTSPSATTPDAAPTPPPENHDVPVPPPPPPVKTAVPKPLAVPSATATANPLLFGVNQ
jgi:hypothetical protein